MKIIKALGDFTEGGILFPSSKTFYFEENTSTDEENMHLSIKFELKRPGA